MSRAAALQGEDARCNDERGKQRAAIGKRRRPCTQRHLQHLEEQREGDQAFDAAAQQ